MLQRSEQLYQSLMEDIRLCKSKGQDFLGQLECCFHISENYWTLLRDDLIAHDFYSEDEEIHFFKVIKPKFISEIEYYRLVYHSEMFKPDASSAEKVREFWMRESGRCDKFKSSNAEFYSYYTNGRTNLDVLFFIRANSGLYEGMEIKSYNRHPGSATSHDHLVAEVIAQERYQGYVAGRLEPLINEKDHGTTGR